MIVRFLACGAAAAALEAAAVGMTPVAMASTDPAGIPRITWGSFAPAPLSPREDEGDGSDLESYAIVGRDGKDAVVRSTRDEEGSDGYSHIDSPTPSEHRTLSEADEQDFPQEYTDYTDQGWTVPIVSELEAMGLGMGDDEFEIHRHDPIPSDVLRNLPREDLHPEMGWSGSESESEYDYIPEKIDYPMPFVVGEDQGGDLPGMELSKREPESYGRPVGIPPDVTQYTAPGYPPPGMEAHTWRDIYYGRPDGAPPGFYDTPRLIDNGPVINKDPDDDIDVADMVAEDGSDVR